MWSRGYTSWGTPCAINLANGKIIEGRYAFGKIKNLDEISLKNPDDLEQSRLLEGSEANPSPNEENCPMRIDGKSLLRKDVEIVNEVLERHWNSLHSEFVDKETFIVRSWGPDAIEMLNGGDEWIVCDSIEKNALFYRDGGTTHVACRELFDVCAKYSPLERITWHLTPSEQQPT